MLANDAGLEFDENGHLASTGTVNKQLLNELNQLDYYNQPYPKSLANDFGTDTVYPILKNAGINTNDALKTCVEHIIQQITKATKETKLPAANCQLLATGGGAFNGFLMQRLKEEFQALNINVIIPDENLVKYKEALIMALIGVLRWREEYNVLSSVTGASRDSIGGALWNGQEA
jgi:anhydro-N-acetylmuramic acid kinase